MYPNAATGKARPPDKIEDTPSPRQEFLRYLGLAWDPFITPVAEQEFSLSTAPQQCPPSTPSRPIPLSYFIPPSAPTANGNSILSALQQHKPAFVFGAPGMGKTTLRLALDATLRRKSAPTLTITYLFNRHLEATGSPEAYATELSRQLAVDLFIQTLERFNPALALPTRQQVEQLGQVMGLGGRPLRRLARRIINKPDPPGMMGVAHHWYLVNRLPIRHVASSPPLLDLVESLLDVARQSDMPPRQGREELQFGLETAREWGFKHSMALIDGVDTWYRDKRQMFTLLEPLLGETAVWQSKNLYPIYFLPETLQFPINKSIQSLSPLAALNPSQFKLQWDEVDLGRILRARLRAAGSRRVSLNDLADPAWTNNLDQILLREADHSPRRLLTLINRLIDVHVQHVEQEGHSSESPITSADWKDTLGEFADEDSASPPA